MFIKVGFFDILDILLVAFVLYQVYRLIKGTSAMNIFAGIFTLYVLWFVVKALNMELISSILGQFIGVGVIALLIVFQQEIRKFLLLVGSRYNVNNVFTIDKLLKKPIVKDSIVDVLVDTCDYLSSTKTGALIVLEKNVGLSSYAQSGVSIKSEISSELLKNIFFKNSPLHDGAVIIASNKIVAARCILPVSDRVNIPGSMGLRHRAALGLSEVSDAHIIVVSEETGNITFFMHENFKVRISPDELGSFLKNNFTGFIFED